MAGGKAIRAKVDGDRVDATIARAGELGLLGWARIAEDDPGATAIHAEGEPDAVDALAAWLGEADGAAIQPAKVEGHEQLAIRGVSAGPFAVVEVDGGYELRLAVAGATVAWRLRKEPSMDPADKRGATAAQATDADGPLWDSGTYEQGGRVPWPEAIDRGHAVFVLHGDKLRGGFALQRTRPPQWLLIKRRDAHAQRRD
ncbi:MAG TPA: hypothetical protein VI318_20235 [Baekduia sp.]